MDLHEDSELNKQNRSHAAFNGGEANRGRQISLKSSRLVSGPTGKWSFRGFLAIQSVKAVQVWQWLFAAPCFMLTKFPASVLVFFSNVTLHLSSGPPSAVSV